MKRSLAIFPVLIAIAACGKSGTSTAPEAPFGGRPVIVVSIDTLRSDRLPVYGSTRIEAPAFDALAHDAIVFEHAYSHCPLTLPSHLTIFTGMLPQDFNVRDNIGFTFEVTKHSTIAATLKKQGYATGAAVSAYVLRGATGASSGFDSYDDAIPVVPGAAQASLRRRGTETIAVAENWLLAHRNERLFYFLHLYEPHAPYDAPEPYRSRYTDSYDAEVAYADSLLGGFIDFLKKQRLYDESLIVVLSDHGEGLMDHGEQEHGILLYREDLQVPLLIKLPDSVRRGERVSAAVQLSDVFPTIVSAVGARAPGGFRGRSLIERVAPAGENRSIFSETLYPRIHLGWSDLRSLTDEQYQYIDAPVPELYDLRKDPAERSNLTSDERRVVNRLRKELTAHGRSISLPATVDAEQAAKLAALGYISATRPTLNQQLPDPKERIGDIEKVRAAFGLAAQRQYGEAIPALRRVLESDPSWTDVETKLASCYEAVGDYQSAVETYKRALATTPTLAPEIALSLASLLVKLGRFDDAAAHARFALQENPGGAHQILAEIALARGELNSAESEARLTAESPQFHLQGELLMAQVAAAGGRLPEALAATDRLEHDAAAAHRLPFAFLDFVRGDVLARLNRNEESMDAFRREIASFPHDRQAYANLALLQILGGQRSTAHATLESMFRANPDRHTALFAEKTLRTMGDRQGAVHWQHRAESLR